MKLSFSLSSSKPPSSASRLHPPGTLNGGGEEATAVSNKPEFVTVFDPTVVLTTDGASTSRPSIAPLPNTDSWRPPKRMKNLLPPPSDPDSSEASRFVLDTSQPDAAANGSYGLTLRSKGGSDGGESDGGTNPDRETPADRWEPPPVSADQKFREDIKNLPEDRGLEEYEEISVEDFSRALLAGYGWKEGQGIGRNAKEDMKVVEPKRWAGNGGLGYTPEMADKKGRKRRDRPHEDDLPPLPPLPPGSTNGGRKRVVRVIMGEHAGMKGEVVESSTGMLVLSLSRSGVEIRVGLDMVAELGSVEEEKCLKKLRELEIHERNERREDRRGEGREDRKENGRVDKKEYRKEDRRDKGRDDKRKDRRVGGRGAKQDNGKHHRSGDEREREPLSWLRSHIRVRIISKDYKGGKLYLKKGEVVDVVGPMTCDLSMDENGELLQGVDQEILETALPRCGGSVLVLFGRHKGVFGNLVEKDMEKDIAMVQNVDNHELIKVRLEQIAEYVGDPTELN